MAAAPKLRPCRIIQLVGLTNTSIGKPTSTETSRGGYRVINSFRASVGYLQYDGICTFDLSSGDTFVRCDRDPSPFGAHLSQNQPERFFADFCQLYGVVSVRLEL